MRPHAVGILVKDRWELTQKTLESIYYSDQPKPTYDVYLIDNGSNEQNSSKLKEYASTGLVPIKNLLRIPRASIPVAWNLFLSITKNYSFRTKVDNDIILHNTVQKPVEKLPPNASTPEKADALAGAPRSKGIIRGIGQFHKKTAFQNEIKSHTAFLQHMEEFGAKNKVGMVALVSVAPNGTFVDMFRTVTTRAYNKRAYLQSACIQFSKPAFEALGYLDERLIRNCFREYSQRAMLMKVNIGYHPYYGLMHNGATDPIISCVNSELISLSEQAEENPTETCLDTAWSKYRTEIVQQCNSHKIVSIGDYDYQTVSETKALT